MKVFISYHRADTKARDHIESVLLSITKGFPPMQSGSPTVIALILFPIIMASLKRLLT